MHPAHNQEDCQVYSRNTGTCIVIALSVYQFYSTVIDVYIKDLESKCM